MIHESGQIVSVADGTVWVDCASRSDCQRCAEGRGCGGAMMSRVLGQRQHRVRVSLETPGAVVGDRVTLSLDESIILRGSLLAYLVPLGGLILGAVAGQLLAGEAAAIAGGGGGLLLGWAAARIAARRWLAGLQPSARLR